MKNPIDSIIDELPKDKPKRSRRSIYVADTIYKAFEAKVGKGRVSIAVERLMESVVDRGKKR